MRQRHHQQLTEEDGGPAACHEGEDDEPGRAGSTDGAEREPPPRGDRRAEATGDKEQRERAAGPGGAGTITRGSMASGR